MIPNLSQQQRDDVIDVKKDMVTLLEVPFDKLREVVKDDRMASLLLVNLLAEICADLQSDQFNCNATQKMMFRQRINGATMENIVHGMGVNNGPKH